MMVNIRKMTALDLHFLGPSLILVEFVLGVFGPWILGVLTLRMALHHRWPFGLTLFGAYLLSLGVNYIPLFLHAVSLVRSRSADNEIADELSDRHMTFRKYSRQSLYLLVPLVVPIVAALQQWRGRRVPPINVR